MAKETKVGTNPLTIEWPEDVHRLTQLVKLHGTDAVLRINGDQNKLDVFLATLRILAKHAQEKFEVQVIANREAIEAELERQAARNVEAENYRFRRIKEYQKMIDALNEKAPEPDADADDAAGADAEVSADV